MTNQKASATAQRQNLVIQSIKKLSGRTQHWVTISAIVKDLEAQGYATEKHNIRRDLKALLELHYQLEFNDNSTEDRPSRNGLAHGYRWVGKDAEPATGLTLPEALSLVMVERYLSQSLPVLLTQALHNFFEKAHHTLEIHKTSQIKQWPDKICVIQPAQSLIPPHIEPTVLAAVHEALLNEQQLQVVYKASPKPDAQQKAYRLHPLGLILRGSVTYLAAMANDYEAAYLYALHRIKSADMLEEPSRHKEGFNLNEYAKTQGHFGSGDLIAFKARISDSLAALLEETPLNESQQLTQADASGYREINATLPNTWQLTWWILGNGTRIEVLEPEVLRQEIAETLVDAGRFYLSENIDLPPSTEPKF